MLSPDERKNRVVALNTVLTAMYGQDMRLSVLLVRLHFSDAQIQQLRAQYLDGLVDTAIDSIHARLIASEGGERRFQILSQRYGLSGQSAQTLQHIGDELKISGERVRQLEERTLRRIKSRGARESLELALKNYAEGLVGEATS